MAITYNLEVEGDLLVVEAHGADDDLADVQRYGKAIVDACIERGCTHVLADETGLEYRLNTLDTFESAKYLAEMVPGLSRVAIVCNPRQIQEATFWETVATNRGMTVRVFKSAENARDWIDA